MIEGQAHAITPNASRYLMQLCKHFRHKVPADFTEVQGRVDFPFGLVVMSVSGDQLNIDCRAESLEAFLKLQYVLDDHLKRFAWREKLELSWCDFLPTDSPEGHVPSSKV